MDRIEIARVYGESCREEAAALLRILGRIPAPSHHEEERAAFCRDWLLAQGAEDVTIDEAKNVICSLGCDEHEDIVVFAAHTDIVFPDTEELPLEEKDGKLFAPGIGDDTANLVNLLLAARYLIQNRVKTACGILIVANSCEEGLGNLDGTKALFAAYGQRIKGFYSFDCNQGFCTDGAVGSYRYQITCTTAGGHSYSRFGEPNAIAILCSLVDELYRIQPPTLDRTTFNVGRIEGGTTVNSIAQQCSMLYEFRSPSQQCLAIMEEKFRAAVDSFRDRGGELTVELLGVRPGVGEIDHEKLEAFTQRSLDIIRAFHDGPIQTGAASTDSNIPLSMGIPANTIGTVIGARAHTRQEWVELGSLPTGIGMALSLMLQYAE